MIDLFRTLIRSRWSILRAALASVLLSATAHAATSYEWIDTALVADTWQSTPLAAAQEYARNYCKVGGAADGGTCELVSLVPGTWPAYTVTIRWWDKYGNLHGVIPSGLTTRTAQVKFFLSVQPPVPTQCGPPCNGMGDPIDPITGSMYTSQADVTVPDSPLRFMRYYNSQEAGAVDLSPGWRHSYSSRISPRYSKVTFKPFVAGDPDNSSLYDDEAAACTSGFPQIRNRLSAWTSLTASFSNGVCSLSSGATLVGTVTVLSTKMPAPAGVVGFDALRDDGEVVTFLGTGTSIGAPAGRRLKLVQTANGFQLTDERDNVETYDAGGKLLSITTRAGVVQTVTYDSANRLSQIKDSFGHSITLTYNQQTQVSTVKDAASATIQYGYDSARRLYTVTQTDGTAVTYLYENATFPNAITGFLDENNHRKSTWAYDAQGLATITSEAGGANQVTLDYNGDGSVTTTDALGAVRTFNFARTGDRLSVASVSGSQCPTCREPKATTYDATGFVSSRTDYNDNIIQYSNDPVRGLETSRTEAYGTARARTITTEWDPSHQLPALIKTYSGGSATGTPINMISFVYDAQGNMTGRTTTDTTVTPNVARTWTYTYDSFGHVLTADGPRTDFSDVTTYTYNNCTTGGACGHVQTITDALNHVTTFNTYNAHGQPLTITDANNVVTTLTYDARQRLRSAQVGAEITTLDYWPTGLLKKLTRPDAGFLQYTYDDAGRLTRVDDSLGNYIVYTLDAAGNRTAENVFDPANTLVRMRTQVFNTLGQLWKLVGAAGTAAVTTEFGYDANGNQTTASAPLARNSSSLYDELNRLKQVTDPGTGVTQFGYDAQDNLVSVIDPLGHTTQYAYSGFGDLLQTDSPDSGTTIGTYDKAGNLSTTTDARGKTGTYTYDALNRVTSIAYSDLTESFGYDAGQNGVGRLTSAGDSNHTLGWMYDVRGRIKQKTQTVGTVIKTVQYGYNNAGQVVTLTTPTGYVIGYQYTDNRITTVSVNGMYMVDEVTYMPFGPVKGWTWGNGTHTTRAYDLDGRTTSVDSAGATTFGFDDASRITAATDQDASARSWSYGYDAMDRLTVANRTGLSKAWTYDANGNRLTEDGTSSTYVISPVSNRLSSVTGTGARTYTYAATGQVINDGRLTFGYNDAGRMTSISGAGSASYVYNALGERIKKATGGATTYFVYDEAGHLIGEYDGSGALIQEIVWMNDVPVLTLRPSTCGLAIFYIHTDHLNTPRKITARSTPEVVWRWDSDPFGTSAPNQDPDGNSSEFIFNLRFAGQYFDPESGLHYNYFRDYDPYTGRYLESDPLGLAGGMNTYSYVEAAPLSYSDRRGLLLNTVGAAGVSAAATATGTSVGVAAAGLGASAVVGLGAGYVFNKGWEYFAGQPFGGSLYDFFNPTAADGDYSPWSPDPEVNKEFVRDRDRVKELDTKPSPYGDPIKPTCEELRARIKHYEDAIAARNSFTNRWYGGEMNAGHAMRNRILEKELAKLRARLARGDCTC